MKSLVLFLILSLAPCVAQVVPGRYVLELSGEPAAVAAKGARRGAARNSLMAARRTAIRQSQVAARTAVAAHGGAVVESLDTVFNGLIVNIPDAKARELLSVPGAVRLLTVRRVRKSLDRALPLHKVPEAWSQLALGQESAGAGMKIGMIDTGIDVNNPAFAVTLPELDGFPKVLYGTDTRFTNSKIVVAKNYTKLLPDGGDADADDRDGHGTGTSLAAAGGTASTPYGTVTGVAPMAYLGNYKVLDSNGGTSDVIAKAIDDAVADGMDVLNISLGAYVVSYADIALTEVGQAAIANAAAAGVIVVVAAGNSGPDPGTIADYASAADAITVGAIHNDRSLANAVTVDGGGPYVAYPGDGPDPGQIVSGTIFDVTQVDSSGLACTALKSGSVAGKIVLVERGTCAFSTKLNDIAAGGARAAIVYNSSTGSAFYSGAVTVGTATLPVMFVSYSDGLDLKARAAENSGLQAGLDFTGATGFPARTDVVDFSSRGPSVGSTLKPDLVAVGQEIVTGAQNSYSKGESYSASGFIDTAGTSFSAPIAAGAAAVLKAARPGLTVAQYRSLLINGAAPASSAEDVTATTSQAGAGVLNLSAAVSGTVAATPTSVSFGSGGTAVSSTVALSLSNVSAATDTFTLQAVPTGDGPAPAFSVDTVALDPGAAQTVDVTLDASGLAAGEYSGTLVVTGTASGSVARIPYWFGVTGSDPAGISVLYQDYWDYMRSTSYAAVVFRVVDAAGLPYTGSLRPTCSYAGGSVRAFYFAGDIPGTYAVDIRTGLASAMTLKFTIGDVSQTVSIPLY
jgi:minor extracellular serine protease Vpr